MNAVVFERLRGAWRDGFVRSSGFMLATTFLSSLLGFVFWAVAARRYSVPEVGQAATLFAAISFVANFSLLGLNTAVLRFLPTATAKNALVSTLVTGVSLAAGVGVLVWLLCRRLFTPQVVDLGLWAAIATVAIFVLFSLNVAVDSVLLAHAQPSYIFLKNTGAAALRIVVIGVTSAAGGFTLFLIATGPSVLAGAGALILMRARLGYHLRPHVDVAFLRSTMSFCGGNYLSVTFQSLPVMVIPVLLSRVDNAQSAYFYVAWSIANLMYVSVMWVNLCFLAEGARDLQMLGALLRKAARVNAVVVLAMMVGAGVLVPVILPLFGPSYSANASAVVIWMILSAPFVAVIQLVSALLNLQGRVAALTWLSGLNSAMVIGLVAAATQRGLAAVGGAWLLGYALGSGAYVVALVVDRRRHIAHAQAPKLMWLVAGSRVRGRLAAKDRETPT